MEFKPADFKIYSEFMLLAGCVTEAVRRLESALRGDTPPADAFAEIQRLEHTGDEITRRAMRELDRQLTSVVPREDAFRQFARLDAILDTIERLAARAAAFRLPPLPPEPLQLVALIHSCDELLREILARFGERRRVSDLVARMSEIENEADALFQSALAALFHSVSDPILLIKLNELYNFLDRIIDHYEECAQALEDAALKHF
jgi:uncharacterized protein Yka (UPF0111/DUF47 family)